MAIENWEIRLAPVASDGSCFFSSVAIALNESVEAWTRRDKVVASLKKHWRGYLTLGLECPDNFTQRFIRYMTSVSLEEDDLSAYNNIARADGKKTFDDLASLAKHVLRSDCWVDSTTFGAFLKSLDCCVGVVVLDHALQEPLHVFRDFTRDKELYICLWLQDSHYQPIQLVYKGEYLHLCITRKTIRRFMRDCYPRHQHNF